MVHDPKEVEHWVLQKQVNRPRNYNYIADKDLVILPPGEKIELLFKFLTFRDVSYDVNADSTAELIKERNVSIVMTTSSGSDVYQQLDCKVKPHFPCVDHTFRHYEPENSFFKFTIPPFLQYGSDTNFTLEVSNPIAHVKTNPTNNSIEL